MTARVTASAQSGIPPRGPDHDMRNSKSHSMSRTMPKRPRGVDANRPLKHPAPSSLRRAARGTSGAQSAHTATDQASRRHMVGTWRAGKVPVAAQWRRAMARAQSRTFATTPALVGALPMSRSGPLSFVCRSTRGYCSGVIEFGIACQPKVVEQVSEHPGPPKST